MSNAKKNWGFPRWGAYGSDRDASRVRLCDFHGCEKKAEHPAPKSPHTNEKWMFCEEHAAEYNKNWNFFEGMKDEEARAYAKREKRTSEGFAKSSPYGWAGKADADGLTPVERDAFTALGLETGAPIEEVKRTYRRLAKKYHPDTNKGDKEAAERFQAVTFAYEVLKGRTYKVTKS